MAAHMNALTAAQETQSVALAQLVENTCQREFDKMFNAIPPVSKCLQSMEVRYTGGINVLH